MCPEYIIIESVILSYLILCLFQNPHILVKLILISAFINHFQAFCTAISGTCEKKKYLIEIPDDVICLICFSWFLVCIYFGKGNFYIINLGFFTFISKIVNFKFKSNTIFQELIVLLMSSVSSLLLSFYL